MERVVNKAKNHKEAEQWDILQQVSIRPKERQIIAKKLKRKVFGTKIKDVRSVYKIE